MIARLLIHVVKILHWRVDASLFGWSCRIVVMMYILTNHFICCDYRKSWRYSFWNIQWHRGFAFSLLDIEIVNLIPLRWCLFKFISSIESQTTCDPQTCKGGFVHRNSTFPARPPTKREEQKLCPALKTEHNYLLRYKLSNRCNCPCKGTSFVHRNLSLPHPPMCPAKREEQ